MNFIFKLFGWLFSNIFLILVVVAACYAYVYWDDPFGEDTPAGKAVVMFSDEIGMAKSFLADAGIIIADDTTDSISSESTLQQDVASGSVSTGASEEGEHVISQQAAGDDGVEYERQSRSESSTSASMSRTDAEPAETGNDSSAESQDAGMQLADTGSMSDVPQDAYVTPEIEQALSQLHNDGSMDDVKTMLQADKPAKQLMIDARNAFYKRDYDTCISSYKSLIAQEKDNFNALGELGNVYFTQGKMKQAADAYYQAAMIMVSHGEKQRAASLISFLSTVDADKAKKLGAMLMPDEHEQGAL